MGGQTDSGVVIGLLCGALAAACGATRPTAAADKDAPADVGPFAVWSLPADAGLAPADLDARKGWKVLDADAPAAAAAARLEGGAAIETPTLLAVLPAGGQTIALLSKGAGPAKYVRLDLAILDAAGKPAGKIAGLKLAQRTQDAVTIAFQAGAAEAKLSAGLGKCAVEIAPGRGAAGLEVRGLGRYSFLPDFFGNDVLYDAAEVRSARAAVPAESFLVQLLDGQAALAMLVWPPEGGKDDPPGERDVSLLAQGDGPDRRFAASQVGFGGKSIYVALLAGQGIWGGHDLSAAEKDKTFVVPTWRPPFDAQWMTILARRPAVGAAKGLAAETMPLRALPAAGDQPYSDVFVHPWVPSWLAGGEWRLHLEGSLTHMMTGQKEPQPAALVAINYPRDRTVKTPPDAYTLVDVMRQSLGAGPCEYVLDIEGINKTRSTGVAGTGKPTAAATTS